MATPSKVDSEDNRKWFIDRVDSVLQNWIDLHESDSDNFSSMVEHVDEGVLRIRNVSWQIIAVVIASAIALTQLSLLAETALIDLIAISVLIGVAWTLIIAAIRRAILPRMEKVEESYMTGRLTLLDLQSWFQNRTMSISAVSQDRLDLYFEFVKVAVASIYYSVFNSGLRFQSEMRLVKPGEQLEPSLQKLRETASKGYQRYKEIRTELRNPELFLPVLYLLAPFEAQYEAEQGLKEHSSGLMPI